MNIIEQYQQLHAQGKMAGSALVPFADVIADMIGRTGAMTLLDYGCGNASAYHKHELHRFWGVDMPTLYDPAIPAYSTIPQSEFDGVICTDVLEHLDEADIAPTLRKLFMYARHFLFVSVCCRPAKLKLIDGTNAHRTIKPVSWWSTQVLQAGLEMDTRILVALHFTQ